ncbi:MAG: hypothetical protein M3R13_04625 [Armatimonadota bacterium]|nr:hypothetical protein [Armatimonadota bacterium]
MKFAVSVTLIVAVVASTLLASPEPALTYKDIKPIFDSKCVSCHGSQSNSGGLRLDTYAAVLKGGGHGKSVLAKNSAGSRLMKMLKDTVSPRMPMGDKPLTQVQMVKISKWITQGARK